MVIPIAMREVVYEPIFDEASFRGRMFCDEALKIIKGSDLMAFTRLPKLAYPQIVREFYMRFKVYTDEQGATKVNVVIDDETYSFGRKEIAIALGIKHYKVVGRKDKPDDMKNKLTKRHEGSKGLRTSSLDENHWLVDKFLRFYVCPFAHFNEVPKYGYQFWYSLLTRGSIDVPLLVIEMMSKSLKGGAKNKPQRLILPRTITAILKVVGCNINPSQESVSSFGSFSYLRVKKSQELLGRQTGLLEPKKKATLASTSEPQGDTEEEDYEGMIEGDIEEEDHDERQVPVQGESSNPPHIPTQSDWDAYARTRGPTQGDGGDFNSTQGPSQNTWDTYVRAQEGWMHGVDARMQGFGTRLDNIQTTMQGYDTRFNALETQVGGMQGALDDYSYQQNEMYMMQRLAISRQYGEQAANEIFN